MTNAAMQNLFTFAPREMTGSAFWAWVLSALVENNSPEDKDQAFAERRNLAINFCKKIDYDPTRVPYVATEYHLGPGIGRIDIAVLENKPTQGKKAPPLLLIENKLFSCMRAEDLHNQILKYNNKEKNTKLVAMSWRYEVEITWQCNDNNQDNLVVLLTLPQQIEILEKNNKNCPIIKQYYQHALIQIENRKKRLQKLSPDMTLDNIEKLDYKENFLNHDFQWDLLKLLLGDKIFKNLNVYSLNNKDGKPLVQASLNKNSNVSNEDITTLFYRLDCDKKGIYLRLNHYIKVQSEHSNKNKDEHFKEARKNQLRAVIKSITDNKYLLEKLDGYSECNLNNIIDKKSYETSLWYIRFKNNPKTTRDIQEVIYEFHNGFVNSLKKYQVKFDTDFEQITTPSLLSTG